MLSKSKKILALTLIFTLIYTSSNVALAEYASQNTLAPYSIAKLINEHKKEIAAIGAADPSENSAVIGRVGSFLGEYRTKYIEELSTKIADKAKRLIADGSLHVSWREVEAEMAAEIREVALRSGMVKAHEDALLDGISLEFKDLLENEVRANFAADIGPDASTSRNMGAPKIVQAVSDGAIEWLTPEEATKKLNALPNIGSIASLEEHDRKLDEKEVSYEEFLRSFRTELAQMADILKRTRQVDELNLLTIDDKLVFEGENRGDPAVQVVQLMRLDVLRSLSELILQLLPEHKDIDNLKQIRKIKQVFVEHPEEAVLLVKYFESRFNPKNSLDVRGEAAGNIRLKLLGMMRAIKVWAPEEHYIFEKALGIMIAAVKTDYFVKGRTSLVIEINPRAIVGSDESGALVHTPPYSIIWVHVPYGAYGAHSRYTDVARGGLRMIKPDRINMRNKILQECVALSITQNKKHTDIPEGGSKGAFIYDEGLNPVAAAIGYGDGLINCMMDNKLIAVASGWKTIDPLELGPDEGTAPIANLLTARAWMKGLKDWRLLMTGKSQILGGVSHMENDLLSPVEAGNRVTSQGVTQHAFQMVRYLRDIGKIASKGGEPIIFSVTGGLDGDVASGLVERAMNEYGDNAIIRSLVDVSGVMFDPNGLDHTTLKSMYASKAQVIRFPLQKLGRGGFVAEARPGPGEDNYVVLGSDSLAHMNTRALDPEVLAQLNIEKQYKAQAKIGDDDPLITVLERDASGQPAKVKVHSVYLRDAIFFLVKSDMLLTGGGVSNSINQNNWPLFFGSDGKGVSTAITHGANVFIHKEASINLEKRGIVIEPDEKANSVGVEISSRMEVDFNSIFGVEDMKRDLMSAYFSEVLAKCLENARAKFWALRIEAEDAPAASVVTVVSPAMSAEIIRLSELISKSNIVGDRKGDYNDFALDMLSGYFPDISYVDKDYPSILDRVFARMSRERLKAIASKVIAKEVVLNLGTNGVAELVRVSGMDDAQIVDRYLRVAHELNAAGEIKIIVANNAGIAPKEQILKLRDVRKKLRLAIEESLASTDAVIDNVSDLTARIGTHMALRSEGAIELSSIVIIMKKDLVEAVIGDEKLQAMRGSAIRGQYKIMKQGLRKLFAGGDGLLEASSKDELIDRANDLIAKGKKVVVLDDGTLTKELAPSDIRGKAGENYCIVASSSVEDGDSDILPFLNLNAMAMMGVGVLYNDLSLFETAYETFTGKGMEEDLIARLVNKALWIVRVLPRCIKVTDRLPDLNKLKKLFDVAA